MLYPLALTLFLGAFLWNVAHREAAEVTVLRGIGAPFTEQPDGTVSNQVRIKVANRTNAARSYRLTIEGAEGARGARIVAPQNPLPVDAGAMATTSVFVLLPATAFHAGEHPVTIVVDDGAGFRARHPWKLVGPE